jgi:hypothetical protein
MSSLPALFPGADTRAITDRLNVLIREHNEARNPVSVDDLPDADKHTGARRLVNDATATTDGTDWRVG